MLVRLSHSHVRFGSFQRLFYEEDQDALGALLDYSVQQFYPELALLDREAQVVGFLREVCARSARLCASWLAAGFVHGVLNSDNMNITGESFDYGPYRFLPRYDPDFVAAYFDQTGLYAFGRQPRAVLNNLRRLASCFADFAPREQRAAALDGFVEELERARATKLIERLGLVPLGADEDALLASALLDFLAESAPYDQIFFDWYGASAERAARSPERAHYSGARFDVFRRRLDDYEPSDPKRLDHAYFQRERPCSLVIDEIEAIWAAIDERDDWAPFHDKVAAIRQLGAATGGA